MTALRGRAIVACPWSGVPAPGQSPEPATTVAGRSYSPETTPDRNPDSVPPGGRSANMRVTHRDQPMFQDEQGPAASADSPATDSADPESTKQLIDRARLGDREALERLFGRHLAVLQRWASGRLPAWARDLVDTDDIVQDTLLRTFRRLNEFETRGPGALYAYLRQAVFNRIGDELRRRRRRPEHTTLDDRVLEAQGSPLEQAVGREAVARYERALDRLRPEDREAIVARVEFGFSYGELADTLGKCSADAARKTAQRALVKLAEEMSHDAG